MNNKNMKTAIENLLERYYRAVVNVEYYQKEMRFVQEKLEEYIIGKENKK